MYRACLCGSVEQYWSAELQYRSAGKTGVQIQVTSAWYVCYEIKCLPVSSKISDRQLHQDF